VSASRRISMWPSADGRRFWLSDCLLPTRHTLPPSRLKRRRLDQNQYSRVAHVYRSFANVSSDTLRHFLAADLIIYFIGWQFLCRKCLKCLTIQYWRTVPYTVQCTVTVQSDQERNPGGKYSLLRHYSDFCGYMTG